MDVQGLQVNSVDSAGETPLITALDNDMFSVAQRLIDAGANVNVKSKSLACGTLLHHYSSRGNIDVIKMIINSPTFDKASVNLQGGKSGFTPLHLACRGGRDDVCRLLLPMCDINVKDNAGKTAVQLAQINRKASTVAVIEEFVASAA